MGKPKKLNVGKKAENGTVGATFFPESCVVASGKKYFAEIPMLYDSLGTRSLVIPTVSTTIHSLCL